MSKYFSVARLSAPYSTPFARQIFSRLRALCVLFALGGCLACSVIQPVRVLPEGTTQVTGSLGGPWLPNSSPAIIAPYLNVGAMHGVSDDVTLTGALHATMLPFGVLGLDLGAATRLVKQDGAIPEITAKAQIYGFYDFTPGATANRPATPDGATDAGAVRIYPYVSLNGSYEITKSLLAYLAVENVFQFAIEPRFLITPTVGLQYAFSPTFSLQGEWKWMAANTDTRFGIFQGQSAIGGNGNWGVFLGFNWTIAQKAVAAGESAPRE
jgi:hypothetical protein